MVFNVHWPVNITSRENPVSCPVRHRTVTSKERLHTRFRHVQAVSKLADIQIPLSQCGLRTNFKCLAKIAMRTERFGPLFSFPCSISTGKLPQFPIGHACADVKLAQFLIGLACGDLFGQATLEVNYLSLAKRIATSHYQVICSNSIGPS